MKRKPLRSIGAGLSLLLLIIFFAAPSMADGSVRIGWPKVSLSTYPASNGDVRSGLSCKVPADQEVTNRGWPLSYMERKHEPDACDRLSGYVDTTLYPLSASTLAALAVLPGVLISRNLLVGSRKK